MTGLSLVTSSRIVSVGWRGRRSKRFRGLREQRKVRSGSRDYRLLFQGALRSKVEWQLERNMKSKKKVLLSFKDKYRAYFLACEEGVSRTWLKIREDRRQNDRARSQRSG